MAGIYNGSPIANITQDLLFTILLLLPVESILSFSMSCRRYRSLICVDTLWKSLCMRDWGSTPTDALKSCKNFDEVPWMKLYKQVSQLDTVSCHKLSAPKPNGQLGFPSSRASHSFNFVSGCLVLFGGGFEGGRHREDTWVAYISHCSQRMLKWQKVSAGIPSGRFGHTCAVTDNCLVLFGGINDHGNRLNDTWVGQITRQETIDITLSWRLLDAGPMAPPPRGAHAACCIDNRKMVIYGGIGINGLRLSDTWVLELSENLCSGTWHEIVTHPSPPPRSGHTLTCTGRNQMILFGGRGLGYEVLNDIWFLDISAGHLKWIQIQYELQNNLESTSLARVGHSATPILGDRLLIYGGENAYRTRKDDFWVLDTSTIRSISMQQTGQNSKKVLENMWKRLKRTGYKPDSRSFHRACTDESGRNVYVFGGMVDEVIEPADLGGLRFDEELFLVELVVPM